MITVTVAEGDLRPRLKKLGVSLSALAKVLGRTGANMMKKHLVQRDKDEPNQLGGKRTHWWREVSKTVQQPELRKNGESVAIAVSHPHARQKALGGPIYPKRVKFLTIPKIPEAHGRTASTFEHEEGVTLFTLWGDNGGSLAYATDSGVRVAYALRRSVDQKPDPDFFPDGRKMSEALSQKADEYISRKVQEKAEQS